MSTKVILEFVTDNVYFAPEVEELKSAFADFLNEFDDDADPNTINIKAFDTDTMPEKTEFTFTEFVGMLQDGLMEMTAKYIVDGQPPVEFTVDNDYGDNEG